MSELLVTKFCRSMYVALRTIKSVFI